MAGFKLGIIQMRVEPGARAQNIDRAVCMIYGALSKGAQVIVLPEALPLGWTHRSARVEAESIPKGQWCRILADTARKNAVWICSGVIERCGDKIFNSAVLLDDRGKVALVHRKINELDIALDLYAP